MLKLESRCKEHPQTSDPNHLRALAPYVGVDHHHEDDNLACCARACPRSRFIRTDVEPETLHPPFSSPFWVN